MSETPLGPDWWQASDGKWYPPPRPEAPTEQPQTPTGESQVPSGEQPGSPRGPQGPYGGPPAAGAPPPSGPYPAGTGAPGPNRNLILALAGVAAVAVLVLGVLAFNRDSGSDDTTATATTDTTDTTEATPETTEAEPVDQPPETTIAEPDEPTGDGDVRATEFGGYSDEPVDWGDGLVLREYGFSTLEYTGFDGDRMLGTFGAIIENTGDDIKQSLNLSVTFYDEDDQIITTLEDYLLSVHHIPAGGTLGIGYESRDDIFDRPAARLEILYGGEGFRYDDREEGTIEVTDLTVEPDDVFVTVRFEVESTYDYDLDAPSAYAIYRNADGEIVGGDAGPSQPPFIPEGSTARGEIRSLKEIDNLGIDHDQTEVHVDAGHRHRGL